MTTWTSDELDKMGAAKGLEIAPLRRDGAPHKPVTIWVVRVGDDLYVRSWRAGRGAWFRNARVRREGRIWAGGLQKDVAFVEETGSDINDQVDAAYRAKYRPSQYVEPMVSAEVRATTLKLLPRQASS
jgi:hypothetical protein